VSGPAEIRTHALVVGAWFSEAGQRDIFAPDGEFRAPHRAPPMGTAEPANGGYVVSGTWDYCSDSNAPSMPLYRVTGRSDQGSWMSRPRMLRPSSMSR
jgi:3-hydroxy-9,10-secoandrosta-1,3,5(10)-triene-9,17-dione monooxygenase